MKDLKAIRGAFYIRRLIEQGEHENQDFKFAISDARKIARSISAFANNSGGRLLIGVKDNGQIAGIRTEEDIYVVEEAAQRYCRPPQAIEAKAYLCEGGAVVVSVAITSATERPVRVDEGDGQLKSYFRVADENIAVPDFVEYAWRTASSGSTQASIALEGPERRLLDMIADGGETTFDDIARRLHLSVDGTRRAISRLYALKLVTFVHRPGGFRVVIAPEQSDETP